MLQFAQALYGLYAGQGIEQAGQGLVEYALLLGVGAVLAIAVVAVLGGQVTGVLARAGESLASPGAVGGAVCPPPHKCGP
jgi:Flp pilus assembly pilin Flp